MRRLLRNRRGSAAIEFALIAPLVFLLIIGILQMGNYFYVRSAVNHAVDEAARLASVYPVPSDADLTTRFQQQDFGAVADGVPTLTITRGQVNANIDWTQITATTSISINLGFVNLGALPISASKRVYTASS
ncbi:TadE/TadG family type IV pilus assembly protein [Novosphingobium sp. TH158]|uniref:TadE/TadG family type IV pilus assembly protein n=1 Tax=Novosphingobium sp. TH158 TaxID=2067455 RepID=UPI0013044A7B|nr:TadE/TadG family type IV pilus assembly protein [Novosphingobium sp. TH158]